MARNETYRRALAGANGKPIDWNAIAPAKPRMVACVDCGRFHNDAKVASRGYPPLCGPCFSLRLARGL